MVAGIDPTAPLTPDEPGGSGTGPAGPHSDITAPAEPPPPPRSRRSIVWIAIATLVVGGLIGAGVVLLTSDGDDGSEVGVATSTTVATTTSSVPTTTAPGAAPAPTPTTKAPNTPETTAAPSPTTAPSTTTTAPAPVITQFTIVPPMIGCPVPGVAVTATMVWATEGATTVQITSPEATKSFPTSGSSPLSFVCIPGSARAYTITATGPGGTATQTAVVQLVVS